MRAFRKSTNKEKKEHSCQWIHRDLKRENIHRLASSAPCTARRTDWQRLPYRQHTHGTSQHGDDRTFRGETTRRVEMKSCLFSIFFDQHMKERMTSKNMRTFSECYYDSLSECLRERRGDGSKRSVDLLHVGQCSCCCKLSACFHWQENMNK